MDELSMTDLFLSIGQAAEYLGISIDTLRRWEEKGKITSQRLDGKNRFFKRADLEKLKFGDVLTVKEAAKRLEVSPSTLRRIADEGTIPSFVAENGYRQFKVTDLEAFVSRDSKDARAAVVHKSATVEKAAEPSTRARLFSLQRKLSLSSNFLGVVSYIFASILLLSASIFCFLVYAFVAYPKEAAAFFHFEYQQGKKQSVLGAQTSFTSENKAVSFVSAVLQQPAEIALKVARVINPAVEGEVLLPEEEGGTIISQEGKTGQPGEQGIRGENGTNGIPGISGQNGETGATGASGSTGVSGSNGSTGAKGDTGATGATGADGSFSGSYNSSSGLVINAYGTGVGETTALLFYELSTNGSSYVGLKSPDSIVTSTTWTLPAADGTNGQCLSTNGSTVLSFADCATTAITSLNGLTGNTQTLATGTSGSDFTISSSGTMHTFNIPDAGSSARGLVTTGTQTFAGSKTFSSAITAPTSSNTINGLVISSGVLSGVAGLTFTSGNLNLAAGGIINAGTIAGATGVTSSGTITLSSLNTAGALLYTNSSGVVSNTAQGNNGQCLISGGSSTPTWTSCAGASNNYFNQSSGLTYLGNTTSDFAIGGTATSSAKFAVTNINNGIPTASVSAGLNGGMYLTADGKLATTTKQSLTLGDSTTTGNVIINPAGNVGIGDTAPDAKLEVLGASEQLRLTYTDDTVDARMTVDSSGNLTIDGSSDGTGSETLTLTGYSTLAASSVTSFACADCIDFADMEDTLNLDSNLTLDQSTNTWSQTFSGTGGPGLTYLSSGLVSSGTAAGIYLNVLNTATSVPAMVITNAGTSYALRINDDGTTSDSTPFVIDADGGVGIGATSPDAKLEILATGGEQLRLTYTDASVYTGLTVSSGGDLTIDASGNDIVSSDRMTLGTTNAGLSQFTVSGKQTGKSLVMFNETGNQNILVASTSGTTKFTIGNSGNLTVSNTATDVTELAITAYNNAGFTRTSDYFSITRSVDSEKLLYLDANDRFYAGTYRTTGSNYVSLSANNIQGSNGAGLNFLTSGTDDFAFVNDGSTVMTVQDTGSLTTIDNAWLGLGAAAGRIEFDDQGTDEVNILDANVGIGTLIPGTSRLKVVSGSQTGIEVANEGANVALSLKNSDNNTILRLNNSSSNFFDVQHNTDNVLTIDYNDSEKMRITSAGLVGIGTASPTGLVTVEGKATGKALTILNETGNQDIFTASASGTTRFVIQNDGDVGIGTASPTYDLDLYQTVAGELVMRVYNNDTTDGIGHLLVGSNGGGHINLYSNSDASSVNGIAPDTSGIVTDFTDMAFATGTSGSAAEYMRLTTGGKLGVGLSSPTGLFHVNGKVTGKALTVLNETGNQDIFTASSSGNTRFVIANSGNVGIGTATPSDILTVQSTGNGEGITIANDRPILTFDDTNANNWTIGMNSTDFRISEETLGDVFNIDADTGHVGIGTSSITNPNETLFVSSDNTTTNALAVHANSLTTGYGLHVYTNSADTSSRRVLSVVNDNSAASGAVAFYIRQDSTGDIMNVFDGSDEVFTILDGGNVGIGTASAATTLSLYETTTAGITLAKAGGAFMQLFSSDTSGTYYNGIVFDDAHDFRITTSGSKQTGFPGGGWFVLEADGDFRLGSVTTLGDARVTVSANDSKGSAITGMNYYGTVGTADVGISMDAGTYMGGITINDTEAGDMYFSMGDSDSLADRETNVKMVLAQDGSLGIGTTTPTHKLDLSGTANVLQTMSSSSTTGTWLQLTNTSTGGGTYSIISTGSSNGEGVGKLLFNNSGGPRLVIDSDGDIGVGQTAPAVKLHVGSTSITDGTTLLRLQDANSTCNFTADTGSPTCGSDETLKKDISSLSTSDLLTKIAGLRPVSYHWKTDGGDAPLNYGFIAQEVEAVFPELVTEDTWADGSTKKFLNIGGLVPYIIGAVKEQQLQIDYLSDTLGLSDEDKKVLGVANKASSSALISDEQQESFTPAMLVKNEAELLAYSGLSKTAIDNYKLWKMTGNLVFTGNISFAEVTRFLNNVIFTSDTVGMITIPENTTKIAVTFTKPFTRTPIVNLTPVKSIKGEYALEEVTKKGFILSLKEGQEEEVVFNWTAFISEGEQPKVKVLETPVPSDVVEIPTPTKVLAPSINADLSATQKPSLEPTVASSESAEVSL
ncbi:MAG: helix-turn-helix domain-containing protein [Patescibacteria group bacterium]